MPETDGTVTLGSGVRTAASMAAPGRATQARSVVIKTAGPERWLAYGEVLVATGRHPVTADLSLALLRPGRRGDSTAEIACRDTPRHVGGLLLGEPARLPGKP